MSITGYVRDRLRKWSIIRNRTTAATPNIRSAWPIDMGMNIKMRTLGQMIANRKAITSSTMSKRGIFGILLSLCYQKQLSMLWLTNHFYC